MEHIISSLVKPSTFAVLAILTQDGNTVLRPIGGEWGSDITEAVREAAEKYQSCKMRLFEHTYDDWRRYFEGIVPREQLL